ncbi:MAG: response regulator transcription factor [Thermomicrobiales bacterium]|nr:response regulator transcription factor [Thermomicrobiales bacterium]
MRILLVDDDPKLSSIVQRVLAQERIETDLADDGEAGLDLALSGAYDAILLDRLLPKRDGVSVVRALRDEGVDTPVLMLTALGDLDERVHGLDAGADDYLPKPFAFAELLARLRALARRSERPIAPEVVDVGDVRIDLARRTVERAGAPVDLSPKEWSLLELLARHRGQILSRDQMLERVWGFDADPQGNVVDLYIHYLRRKLDRADGPSVIRTVRGAGYALGPG